MSMEDRDWYRAEARTRRAKSEDAAAPAWRAFENRPSALDVKNTGRLHFGPLGWVAVTVIMTVLIVSERKSSWLDHPIAYVVETVRAATYDSFPVSGSVKIYFERNNRRLVPLTIQTSPADLDLKTVISVREWNTDRNFASIFLEANSILTADLPPGVYRLWIASGHRWHDGTKLFGISTRVQRSLTPVILVNDRNGIHGCFVRLMQTDLPNFPTESARPLEFGTP